MDSHWLSSVITHMNMKLHETRFLARPGLRTEMADRSSASSQALSVQPISRNSARSKSAASLKVLRLRSHKQTTSALSIIHLDPYRLSIPISANTAKQVTKSFRRKVAYLHPAFSSFGHTKTTSLYLSNLTKALLSPYSTAHSLFSQFTQSSIRIRRPGQAVRLVRRGPSPHLGRFKMEMDPPPPVEARSESPGPPLYRRQPVRIACVQFDPKVCLIHSLICAVLC